MTSTSTFSGLNEARNSSKVLKAPGGGTSDIFGGTIPSTPRSKKNHMASNIFAAPSDIKNSNGDSARRPGQNSHNRLFGQSERPPITPSKNNTYKSNLPFINKDEVVKNGNGHVANGNHATNGNGVAHTNGKTNGHANGHAINGNDHHDGVQNGHTNGHKADGNPVTGEGYRANGGAEINTSVPTLNGARQVINKNRIPPGGFSSGLW